MACKIIPVRLNFRDLAPASMSNQPQPAKSAIFGKTGQKMINLAGTFLHNGAQGWMNVRESYLVNNR